MSFTDYFRYTVGSNIYAKPLPLNTSPWSADIIAGSDPNALGSFTFSGLTEDVSYEVFEQLGVIPQSTDLPIGQIYKALSATNITTSTTVIET